MFGARSRTCVRYCTEHLFGVKSKPDTSNSLPIVSDRFEGYGVPRAFALVIRRAIESVQVLVFDHPDGTVQFPKGRIDPEESTRHAASRELEEESGLHLDPAQHLGTLIHRFSHPADGSAVSEEWHCWLFEATGLPDEWVHYAIEEDQYLRYRWVSIDDCVETIHPHLTQVAQHLLETMAEDT